MASIPRRQSRKAPVQLATSISIPIPTMIRKDQNTGATGGCSTVPSAATKSFNPGTTPARAVIARTDPHEQESVVLLPELEHLVP